MSTPASPASSNFAQSAPSASPVIALFPRRPLQLQAVHVRSSLWTRILMVVGAIFIAYGTLSSTASLYDDFRLHSRGTLAQQAHFTNGVCHERLLYTCSLDAEFTAADGSMHTKKVEYTTILQKPNQDTPFTLRYDPVAPEHISTSWGMALAVNRVITALLGYVLLFGLIASFVGSIGSKGRLRRELDSIGAQPTPIEARFVKAVSAPNSVKATLFYNWIDATGTSHPGSFEMVGQREPFWLDAAKTRMLAVAGANNKTYLLDSRLESVSLTQQERAQLIAARDRSLNI